MPTYGVIKRNTTCPLCKKSIKKGSTVYHDSTKSPKSSIVHSLCFEELLKKRGSLLYKTGTEVKSTEELAPPF